MVKTSEILKELQSKIAQLEARVKELERPPIVAAPPAPAPVAATAPLAAPAPVPAPVVPVVKAEEVTEEIMLVLAAAVAAFFGERAHIRVIRLASSHAWAQQGRVSIQASHRL